MKSAYRLRVCVRVRVCVCLCVCLCVCKTCVVFSLFFFPLASHHRSDHTSKHVAFISSVLIICSANFHCNLSSDFSLFAQHRHNGTAIVIVRLVHNTGTTRVILILILILISRLLHNVGTTMSTWHATAACSHHSQLKLSLAAPE